MSKNTTMKEHWEKVYRDKQPHEVSWWQDHPKTSLDFIHSFNTPKAAQIIDIGGGDSTLVDCLLDEGFENITVLDISERAIERAKLRLGDKARRIHWVVSDVNEFQSERMFDVWHDRATFHFLTSPTPIEQYISIAQRTVSPGGHLVLGTFSSSGPKTCSGLPVHQYDERSLASGLRNGFDKVKCITEDHTTPFNTKQNFLYCSFRRHLSEVEILEYRNELKDHIKRLNIEWLEKYFSVEPHDIIQLSDPENEIINKGGLIYYASRDDEIVGTVTLMKIDNSTYELGKMAVTEKHQGAGIGKKLLEYCIAKAGNIGVDKLILYSNTSLTPAIELYKKYGFVESALDETHYKRANIKMELRIR